MAIATGPTLATLTRPFRETRDTTHRGHRLQLLSTVATTNPLGTMDVWFCHTDHQVLVDTA